MQDCADQALNRTYMESFKEKITGFKKFKLCSNYGKTVPRIQVMKTVPF